MNALIKRLFDIAVSGLGMILFSPLFVVLWILIWAEDHHDPIYRQERIGYHGKPFKLYKFRSMTVDSEDDGIPQLCQDEDNRLTKVGAFLRAHHLDEMPQLWNVLVGDMSIVGYRPERKYFIDKIMENDSRYEELYAMRPGVFSYATLHNGYTDSMEKMLKRLEYDLEYLHHHSVIVDVKLLWQSLTSILTGKKF